MKKRLYAFMILVAVIMNVFTVYAAAEIDLIHSPFVKSYNHSAFVYHGSAMRIQNTGWGGSYIVEFDAQLPEATSGAKYGQDFNWTGKTSTGTTINGVSHSSTIAAASQSDGYIWKWTSGAETVVLEAGVNYHILIAVDLLNQVHSWEITNGDTVVGSAYNQAFKDVPSSEITTLIMCHDLRWGNNWKRTIDDTTGEWADTKPQNVKIMRNSVFAETSPAITFGESEVSANVKLYHNVTDETYSPVLLLCVYSSDGIMTDVTAGRVLFEGRTTTTPAEDELEVTLNTKLTTGMKVKAILIRSLANRTEAVQSTKEIYAEN